MQIEYLSWDSAFFGFKTGKILADKLNKKGIRDSVNKAKTQNYKLIYILTQNTEPEHHNTIVSQGAELVDKKVVFMKEITCKPLPEPDTIVLFNRSQQISPSMYKLALESGAYSRFRLDKKFSTEVFNSFYKTWLKNSVNGLIADDVFVYTENNNIEGFITIKYYNDFGKIGLIAVDSKIKRKKIGTNLILKAENSIYKKNLSCLYVETQKANKIAMNFYKHNNFSVKSITNIYHLWLS